MTRWDSPWKYLWYILCTFLGAALEIVLLCLIEPVLFHGTDSGDYSDAQNIIHRLLTIFCWGTAAFLLTKSAEKRLSPPVISRQAPTGKGIALSGALALVCIAINAFDWGTLKTIGEFQRKGPLLFTFQYLYYFFEAALICLFVIFGQGLFEALLKRASRFPWGGAVLAVAWGAPHFLTKGSFSDGVCAMLFALLDGEIYLLLGRSTKFSYCIITLAFIV